MAKDETREGIAPPAEGGVVKSAGRVLEVFELFRELRRPLTATDIGRALRYPKSSTNALLKSLVALGYLSFSRPSLTYFPTLRLTGLADWVPSALFGSEDTQNLLEELHEATGETITLSMHNELSMQFLRAIPGTFPISLRIVEGYMVPVFGTAVGGAYLATRPDDEILALIDRANARTRRRGAKLDPDAVLKEIATIRDRGYSLAYDRVVEDTGAVAVALPAALEGRTLVVAIAGLGDRIKRNERNIIRLLRAAVLRYYPSRRTA
ncbi:MAG TPA: IclR family transcriptional regulator C-terminal domain-containing protein [Steroidobacteraceae bacterium]|nr:IclR family transcriptional regulator C-terminal domain-containing protein [Steroidobacteraceae bacterium]